MHPVFLMHTLDKALAQYLSEMLPAMVANMHLLTVDTVLSVILAHVLMLMMQEFHAKSVSYL